MAWVVNATHRPLYPRERPDTHCTGGWVGLRDDLEGYEKARPLRNSIPDRPTRSESLYRLSYIGSLIYINVFLCVCIYIYIYTYIHIRIYVCILSTLEPREGWSRHTIVHVRQDLSELNKQMNNARNRLALWPRLPSVISVFVFRWNGRVHLNRLWGVSSVDCWQPKCAASAVVMLDTPCSEVVWMVLANNGMRQSI